MSFAKLPNITCVKRSLPAIYLDSCAVIELARYNYGICSCKYKNEIGELFNMLSSLMNSNKILCPYGNQLSEIGMTTKRDKSRNFLFNFTNDRFLEPNSIYINQLQVGYQSFIKKDEKIVLNICDAYDEAYSLTSLKVFATPIYDENEAESLKNEKEHISDILNEIKKSGRTKKNFYEQLKAELETDKTLLYFNGFANSITTEEAFQMYFSELEKFYTITGLPAGCNDIDFNNELLQYTAFLDSLHHHVLPYIWIQSNIWAYLMQRQNKILKSDNLDVKWASAYLPYVDFVITDTNFCKTLNETKLAEQYNVKTYSMSTLHELINELKKL